MADRPTATRERPTRASSSRVTTSSTRTGTARAGSRTPTSSRRDRRRDMRQRTKRRVRGGDGVGPLWLQHGALQAMMGIHRVRASIVRFFAGDKPFLMGFVALLGVGVLIITGPLNTYLDQRSQLEVLQEQTSVLEVANRDLAASAEALQGPEAVELRAREEFGLIRPGEVPYVVVPPQQDRPAITRSLEIDTPAERSTLGSVWDALTGLFG